MPPRRSASGPMTTTNAEASSSTSFSSVAAVDSPSPIIAKLRKMWQFAVVCQFMHTFDEAFGMSGFETESLERDLDGQETAVIPDLMRRLLYTLTLDRRVSIENWQDKTRNQFLKREPQNNPFGTVEEPRSWEELSLTQKVETLRAACEWHFQDSERFRKLVKSEEDAESWRIEPIGWDAKGNTYWLFDDNRLWVQYAPPPEPVRELPPASKGTKRARAEARRAAAEAKKAGTAMPSKAGRKPKVKKNHSSSNSSSSSLKRGRSDDTPNEDADEEEEDEYEDLLDDDDDEDEDDEGRNRKRLRTRTSKAAPLPRRNASRSAAADATRNIKRNAIENAAALADLQSSPSKRNGVRTSRRLKGGEGEEGGSDGEWESIPEELLREGKDDDDDESLSDPPSGDENENDSGSEDDEDQDQDQDQDQDEEMEEDGDQMEVESSSQDGKGIQENNFQSSSDRVDANGDSTMSEKEENSAQDQRIDGEVKADQDGTDDDKMQVDETNPEGSEVKVEKTEEEKRQEEEDKVEFETVAVTLLEWDAIINQFSKARHPDEKNLYKFLKDEIYPKVTKELAELEKARAQEMLLASRKRSSRIAIKESEKEEKERDRIARMSMEERMSGVRAEEEEKFSKEDLAKQREWERERKIKEREERALAREKEAEEKARKEELERIQKEIERDERQRRRDDLIANGGDPSTVGSSPEPFDKAPQVQAPVASKSGSKPASAVPKKKGRPSKKQAEEVQQPKGKATEDWELSCEVCGSRGKNLQESSQIVCCEQCGVWQHVKCWNNQDKRMGAETLRKWSEIDFYCSKCKPPKDPQFMPPYPNSKPLPAGFVVQRLKRPPRNRNSISKDPEEGKGKEKEGTPVEKKPRAPPKPRGSNASTSSTAPSSPAVGQAQSQAQAQAPLPAQTANLQQPAAQQSTLQALSSQANGHSAPSASAQHTIEAQSHQQPSSSTQAPPGNLALGSLPPPILNNTNGSPSTNGLGSAFVHQPSNQSPSINGIPRSSPGASISNQSNSIMSPRSPSGLPRSNQPSGSFPIRRDAPARSPLSRPYDSPTDIPPLTIERPQSPTPNLGGHSRNGSGSSTMTPLQRGVAASSNSNPTFSSNGPSTNGDKNALYQRQVAAPSSSSSRSEGPGPISGSIRQRLPSDPSKQFGPSPPRQLYGSSDPSSSSSTSNSITPPNSNGNGSMAPPSSRPFQQPNSNLVNQTPISSNDSVPMQIDSTSSVQVPQANVSNQQSSSSNPPPPSS